MSDEIETPAWVWQGFFGPMAAAEAGKRVTDALPPEQAGVKLPMAGEPPATVDLAGTTGIFAIQTRPATPVPAPEGMAEANPAMVGRLVGG
ncbi:hypothetical protein [Falsiroseomonas selenitidurans]|uniref:Uncharacterized protein n=1 Tax=Falsiroseomonas selenitidurans TaxID=2716335 RepID=A0ABX1E5B4_9PROT|nr:hypothetical protein [Falsiroseomonas selenitidurans]NKC32166.1 hypothetical protein [Falsiroseomonas selenitidurans]